MKYVITCGFLLSVIASTRAAGYRGPQGSYSSPSSPIGLSHQDYAAFAYASSSAAICHPGSVQSMMAMSQTVPPLVPAQPIDGTVLNRVLAELALVRQQYQDLKRDNQSLNDKLRNLQEKFLLWRPTTPLSPSTAAYAAPTPQATPKSSTPQVKHGYRSNSEGDSCGNGFSSAEERKKRATRHIIKGIDDINEKMNIILQQTTRTSAQQSGSNLSNSAPTQPMSFGPANNLPVSVSADLATLKPCNHL